MNGKKRNENNGYQGKIVWLIGELNNSKDGHNFLKEWQTQKIIIIVYRLWTEGYMHWILRVQWIHACNFS